MCRPPRRPSPRASRRLQIKRMTAGWSAQSMPYVCLPAGGVGRALCENARAWQMKRPAGPRAPGVSASPCNSLTIHRLTGVGDEGGLIVQPACVQQLAVSVRSRRFGPRGVKAVLARQSVTRHDFSGGTPFGETRRKRPPPLVNRPYQNGGTTPATHPRKPPVAQDCTLTHGRLYHADR